MPKRKFKRKQRVQGCIVQPCRTKLANYWQPLPFDKKDKFIPSSVDCLYNQDYYSIEDSSEMLRSL